jgi:polyprenyl-phospho-N-acetylgalactosaminyl synthase
MRKQIDTYVIVPIYKESPEVVLPTLMTLLDRSYRVVVVVDSKEECYESEFASLPIYYLKHCLNLGQGAALRTGTQFSLHLGAEYIVHFDADGQHNAEDIATLLGPLERNETDVVLGSRYLEKGFTHGQPATRRTVIKLAIYINWLFTGLKLTDAHNGLRAMNRNAANCVRITENRQAHATQILAEIKRNYLRYQEVPVHIHYTKYSLSKGQSAWNSIRILYNLIISKLF